MLLSLAWKLYLDSLRQKPLATKILTSATISALGEVVAQAIRRGPLLTLPSRLRGVASMALLGAVWGGPSAHFFYKALDAIASPIDGRGLLTLAVKTLVDQLTYGPACTAVFLSWISAVKEGRGLASARQALGRFWPIQLQSWRVWPAASFLAYALPQDLRVLFMNLVALGWNAFVLLRSPGRRSTPPAAPVPAPAEALKQQPGSRQPPSEPPVTEGSTSRRRVLVIRDGKAEDLTAAMDSTEGPPTPPHHRSGAVRSVQLAQGRGHWRKLFFRNCGPPHCRQVWRRCRGPQCLPERPGLLGASGLRLIHPLS